MEEKQKMLEELDQISIAKETKKDISVKIIMNVIAVMAVTIVGLVAIIAFLLVNGDTAAQLKNPVASKLKNPSSDSSLSFSWITPMSLKVWNEDGQEDVIHLRPAGKVGGVRVQCLYDGYLQDDEEATVSIYGCQNWAKIEIVILSKYSDGSMFNFLPENGTTQEEIDPYLTNSDEDKNEQSKRSKRSNFVFPGEEDYLDLDFAGGQNDPLPKSVNHRFIAAFDKALFDKLDQNITKCKEYVTKIIRMAQPYYLHGSLGIKVFFQVTEEIKFIENHEFKIDPSEPGSHMIDATKIESKYPLSIFTFTDDTKEWRGVAPRRMACHATQGRAITKWRSEDLKCARTFAHEHGHWFALYHDAQEDKSEKLIVSGSCTGEGLMTDVENPLPKWSECSRSRIERWFHRDGKKCLKEVSPCVNQDWKVPCICGKNQKETLCSGQYEVCEDSTGTCHVNSKAEAELTKLKTCSSFSATAGQPLESGCLQPQELTNGLFMCEENGNICHGVCHPGFKLDTSDRFMECTNNQWSPLAITFNCVLDCQYKGNSQNPACIEDEVIFISGGAGTDTSSELVDVAPSGAGCGRVTGKLPDNRYGHSMDMLNGKLVICGGRSSSAGTSCKAASSPSGPWSAHSTTTGRRFAHGSSTVGSVVHLIGGGDSASMESWEGDKWITKANPPVNFGWGTCATNVGDNTMVVIGGSGSHNKVALYRVEEDEWEELGEMPVGSGRKYHGCVYLGDGQVLVGGGLDESRVNLKSCGIYHIEEERWEDVGDMNSARYGVRFVAVNVDGRRRFFALGGYDGNNLDSIEEFDRKTKTWVVSPVRMAEGRRLFGAVVLKKTNVC